jgi:hypothetical protein
MAIEIINASKPAHLNLFALSMVTFPILAIPIDGLIK